MTSLPPLGMASRALAARFMSTCSICTGSALTLPSLFPGTNSNSIFSDQTRQHLVDFLDDRVQIEQLQGLHLLASEGQQLPRQISGAARGLLYLIHITAQRMLRRQ